MTSCHVLKMVQNENAILDLVTFKGFMERPERPRIQFWFQKILGGIRQKSSQTKVATLFLDY